jgi:hypothetical protein
MDWPKFRRVERQARRLHEVMERLDVPRRIGATAAWRCLCGGAHPLPVLWNKRQMSALARWPSTREQKTGVLP